MSYLHIKNLDKDPRILQFRQVYALEKVHGTSAHVAWDGSGNIRLFSGGEKHARFAGLFDLSQLEALFRDHCGDRPMTVYGEAYGGSQQGMSAAYGKDLRFVAFDCLGADKWLDVPSAEALVNHLGLEFVPFHFTSTDLAALDAHRDHPSEVAVRRGITAPMPREGVVLRPPFEVTLNNGERLIAKYKGAAFSETKTVRLVDPTKALMLTEATAVAEEWVTPMRLTHVLDRVLVGGATATAARTREVIEAMVEDVLREGHPEVEDTREVRAAIGRKTATLYQERVKKLETT